MTDKSKATIVDKFITSENWNWVDYKIPQRKSLRIDGIWQPKFENLLDGSILEVCINAGCLVVDLSFIKEFPHIKSLYVCCESIENFNAVKDLPELEILSIVTSKNQRLNLDIHSNLKALSLDWKTKFEINSLPKSIEYLSIDKGVNINWRKLLESKNSLLKVDLVDCDIDAADIFFKLKALRYLALTGCKKISFDNVVKNNSLRFIDLREIPLKTLRWLNSIKGIEIICVTSAGRIDTLSNIKSQDSIIGLLIAGNTVIEDGDLSNLETFKNVRNCFIVDRKHYNLKSTESWNWKNFNLPKKELFKFKRVPNKSI